MDTEVTIFIVEDDAALADEIRQFLEKWGYRAVMAERFRDIAAEVRACCPQLILMDINLPWFDGFYWCRKIRESSHVPILFISSRDDEKDKIMAIAQGGDDFVEKPFHLELLKAKIEAVVRRTYQYKIQTPVYVAPELSFEQDTSCLSFRGRKLEFTGSEQKIMSKLLEQRPGVVTREELMTALWGMDEFVSDGTLTTLICRLRHKLKAFCSDELILTKKGQGYYIE